MTKKQNIPFVGCRANDIENLFTAELRVASEKEKDRQLKCTKAGQKQQREIPKNPEKPVKLCIKWHAEKEMSFVKVTSARVKLLKSSSQKGHNLQLASDINFSFAFRSHQTTSGIGSKAHEPNIYNHSSNDKQQLL